MNHSCLKIFLLGKLSPVEGLGKFGYKNVNVSPQGKTVSKTLFWIALGPLGLLNSDSNSLPLLHVVFIKQFPSAFLR
jgi:hypothetical protein